MNKNEAAILRRLSASRAELSAIQARLGTVAEQSGDMDRAAVVAHDIANIFTAIALLSSESGEPARHGQ